MLEPKPEPPPKPDEVEVPPKGLGAGALAGAPKGLGELCPALLFEEEGPPKGLGGCPGLELWLEDAPNPLPEVLLGLVAAPKGLGDAVDIPPPKGLGAPTEAPPPPKGLFTAEPVLALEPNGFAEEGAPAGGGGGRVTLPSDPSAP